MIEVKELIKSFDGVPALDGLNLCVPRGCIYGLVGPNGAGKSTVIRHLTGILRQDSGEVLVASEPVFENPSVKRRIAYIPDEIFYRTQATVNDTMKFYRSIYPSFDMQRFEELSKCFDISTKSRMRHLSKGMQKQAAFWLNLSLRPEIIILDEPVDGLDPVMRRQVWKLILEDVAERGTTVLISSHNLRELEDVCDHVGIMNKGKMLIERSLAELQENIVKIQLAMPDGAQLPPELEIVHRSQTGRLQQLIVRGRQEEVEARINAAKPLFVDVLPLSLEEIFIYEIGGVTDEVKSIVI